MEYVRGRYSWVLRPILLVYDLFIINFFAYCFLSLNDNELFFFSYGFLNNKQLLYAIYSSIFWSLSAYFVKFYKVYRYTSPINITTLLIKQFCVYAIITFAFVGAFRSVDLSAFVTLRYLLFCIVCISFVKFLSYYGLRVYRARLKGNLRNILVVGDGDSINEIQKIFINSQELGYVLKGVYSKSNNDFNSSGDIEDCFSYLEQNKNIDEIYCAIDELSEQEITKLIQFSEMNKCNIKFIPNDNKILTKRFKTDYYKYLPVLSLPNVALNDDLNKFLKRGFDITFSILIIICIMSWLSIVLFILIKLESKGPLFYKHKRHGINYKEFYCYKYRSLRTTEEKKGTYVKPSDKRVTKIGKFLRKTSLDELPQFINVLKGDMSVVGPRPHMLSYTEDYSKVIDKYNFMFRHNVKPGITGLAQVSGFRGEIETDKDIINRVKYDIFYIENWSLLLDIKIIVQTFVNALRGEKKAY